MTIEEVMDKLNSLPPNRRLYFTTAGTPFPDSYAQRISELLGDSIDVYDRQGRVFVNGKRKEVSE